MTISNDIKSRGHWLIRIKPTIFNAKQISSFSKLEELIYASSVNARGWDFPHIDYNNTPKRFDDYIEQETDWHLFKEVWRLYLSGQFIFLGALWAEWRDKSPGNFGALDQSNAPVLFVSDTVAKWTELLFFASKLMTKMEVDSVDIDVTLKGLQGRSLYVPPINRMPFVTPKTANIQEFSRSLHLNVPDLSQRYREIAVDECLETFARFGWDTTKENLQGFQRETFGNNSI